jgi:SAM-dependent methyltransferase
MSEQFYSDARLYDRLFPGGEQAVDFYRAEADRQGGCVLELGCGTGHKLIPIASDGHPCMGLELSPDMLAEAPRKADERGVETEWVQGDMREFDLAERSTSCLSPPIHCSICMRLRTWWTASGRCDGTWRPEHGSSSTCSTRACARLPRPTAFDAGATRCRSWIHIVA